MNYITPRYTLNHSDDLLFQQHKIHQDTLQVLPPSSLDRRHNILPVNLDKSRRRKSSDIPAKNEAAAGTNDNNKKKIIHRDIERQRRQEMATLYASLRSLLPLERIKGKRSISDHMNEAANYIRHLEKKIQELSDKREGLKRFTGGSLCPSDCVSVQPCWAGVEVVIRTAGVPLSRLLEVFVKEGLSVVSCLSTKVNEMSLHTIQSEASTSVDLSELQHKLTELVESWSTQILE